MADVLTPWEHLLLGMPIDDWLDLENCDCEGTCLCEEEQNDPR